MDHDETLRRELSSLQSRIEQIEGELGRAAAMRDWRPAGFYGIYGALAGAVLGLIGAASSLLFNVIGSLAIGQHPLHLIQVYLTFPMGADALTMESGLAVAIGCCLYLFTGMVLGVPFAILLGGTFGNASNMVRFFVTTVLSLGLWLVNFYGILSWLQPELFGGRWIVEQIPWYVGAATHLVFGWTMLALMPLGRFVREARVDTHTEKL
jgi:hypothetical protein